MRTKTVSTLMIVLTLGVGCQTTPRAPAPSAALGVDSSSAPSVERPDDGTFFQGTAPPPPPEQFAPVAQLADVHFEYDAHDIGPSDTSVLDRNAAWLKANPDALVLIEGHTDERGTSEYNLGLGDLRAAAAKRYLMAQGIPAARMVTISYGKERPLCTDPNEACWARNRRAHFVAKPN
jgi:peptidoglycan-associated lipoprotein